MPSPDPAPLPVDHIRVVIVDADDRTRDSLAGLLSINERVRVVGCAGQPGAALDIVTATRPDVVIMDPRLPDMDAGTALISRLREAVPATRILAMGLSGNAERVGIDCGADGSVRKTFRPSELLAAVIAAGRRAGA